MNLFLLLFYLFIYLQSISWILSGIDLWFIASGKAAEFGLLKDGYMFETSTGLSRRWAYCSQFMLIPIEIQDLSWKNLLIVVNVTTKKLLNFSVYVPWIDLTMSFRLRSSPTCPVLEELGKQISFEIAVGLNGRVWVRLFTSLSLLMIVALLPLNTNSLLLTSKTQTLEPEPVYSNIPLILICWFSFIPFLN